MLKKNIVFILVAIIVALPISAQKNSKSKKDSAEWKKELQDFKYKYLAQEIELTEDQQSQFFELYSKMEAEIDFAFKNAKDATKALKSEGEHSEEEYQKAVNAMLNVKIMEAQIEKRYYDQLKSFISSQQLYKLKCAERNFKKKLMEMHKNCKK